MSKKKVCLVGFAITTRKQTPWDEDYEFWGCNEGYVQDFPKIDRWFQIHPYISFSRADNMNDPKHFEWLMQEHDFEIYMQEKFPFVPSAEKYPLDIYTQWYGRRYFRSSFDYMMAMAIMEGYEEIGIFGFEMASNTEYHHQRPSAEYWIGRAEGMGITIREPNGWNLLRGSLYGYEDNSVGFRQQLEMRSAFIRKNLEKEKQNFYKLNGACEELERLLNLAKNPENTGFDPNKDFTDRQNEMIKQGALVNTYTGAQQEVENMIRIFDDHSGMKSVTTTESEEQNAEKKES